jgi:hypothetical protein
VSGIVLEARDVLTLLVALAPSLTIYVKMRESQVKTETKLDAATASIAEVKEMLTRQVAESRSERGVHGDSISEVREELAGLRQRVQALEHPRTTTGSYQALGAEQTGPHKTHP